MTKKENEMIDWVHLIVEESLHVGVIKERTFITFKDNHVNFSEERLKEGLFNMTKMS